MLDHILSAQQFQVMDTYAESFWTPDRQIGRDHLRYFAGRMYGQQPVAVDRPLNLVAQTVRAFLPKLVPARIRHDPTPRRAGLDLEALVLRRLLERSDEQQDIIHNVFEPMIAEPWFYPLSVCYTGIRQGARVLDLQGHQIRPGEPFVLHIPFERWAMDPFAEDFRGRQWERHRYRVPRAWMLESPAFAHLGADFINKLPAWEDSPTARDFLINQRKAMTSIGGSSYAAQPTIELINVVIYDRSGIYEATITPQGRGPAQWLRAVKTEVCEDGPYDHLWYQGVPSMLVPAALVSFTRGLAEAGDMLMSKQIDSAMRSKRVLCYASGAEDEAKAMLENPHGTMLNVEDPQNVKVVDLDILNGQLTQMVAFIQEQWDEASGSPRLLQGAQTGDNTATKNANRNNRASEQITALTNKIERVIQRTSRKRAYYFQTDPWADHVLDVRSADGSVLELAYNVDNRQGQPDDFAIKCNIATTMGSDTELAMRRCIEVMDTVGRFMPLFQMGIFDLSKTLKFFQRNGADGLEEIAGDMTMVAQRMAADAYAKAFTDRAAGQGDYVGMPPPGAAEQIDAMTQMQAAGRGRPQPSTRQGLRQQAGQPAGGE